MSDDDKVIHVPRADVSGLDSPRCHAPAARAGSETYREEAQRFMQSEDFLQWVRGHKTTEFLEDLIAAALAHVAEDARRPLESQLASLRSDLTEYIDACRDRVRELQARAEREQDTDWQDAIPFWAMREAYEHAVVELQGVLSRALASEPSSAKKEE